MEMPVSLTSPEYLEKFYTEPLSDIASTGLIVGTKNLYLSLDVKDTLGLVKSTKIFNIPLLPVNEDILKQEDNFELPSLKFGSPVLMDEIDNRGCSNSSYIASLNIIVRMCKEDLKIVFKLNSLNSNLVDTLLIDAFQGTQTVNLEEYNYIILPSSDPSKVQFVAYRKKRNKITKFFCTRSEFIERVDFFVRFGIESLHYIGKFGLLGQDSQERWWFKTAIFGNEVQKGEASKVTDMQAAWNLITEGGQYINSFYSSLGDFLVEFLIKEKKDESQVGSVDSWNIIAFKYDLDSNAFSMFRRWGFKYSEQLKKRLLAVEILDISRTNIPGFIITFIKERHTFVKEEGSQYSKQAISNLMVYTTEDYAYDFKPNRENSQDSFANRLIKMPHGNIILEFYEEGFKVGSEKKDQFKTCIFKMTTISRPLNFVGWDVLSSKQDTDQQKWIAMQQLSFWPQNQMGGIMPGTRNFTVNWPSTEFGVDWGKIQRGNWLSDEQVNLKDRIWTIFSGVVDSLELRSFVNGNFIQRKQIEPNTSRGIKILKALQSQELCLEKDFKKIEDLMSMSSLDSFTSRLSFSPKGLSRPQIEGLHGLQSESVDGTKTAVIIRKYSNERQTRVFDITPRLNSTTLKLILKQSGKVQKILHFQKNHFLMLNQFGKIHQVVLPGFEESELNFSGKPCMDMLVVQTSKLKQTLVCVEEGLMLSLFYTDSLIMGYTGEATVYIRLHDKFKQLKDSVSLSQEKEKRFTTFHTTSFPDMIYICLRNRKKGEVNFLIYNINAGMSVEVKLVGEIEVVPHLVSQKPRKEQQMIPGMYTFIDFVMMGDYLVMLIEDGSKDLWISVKYLIAPTLYKHLKLVRLDSSIRLSDQTKLLQLSEITKQQVSLMNSPILAFKVAILGKENVLIIDPAAPQLEMFPFFVLPEHEEYGIDIFPVYFQSLKRSYQSLGVVRYQFSSTNSSMIPDNLVHIFTPSHPLLKAKDNSSRNVTSVFLPQSNQIHEEIVYISNSISSVSNQDKNPNDFSMTIKYKFALGDNQFRFRSDADVSDPTKLTKTISQVLDLKGFTSPITNKIDKLVYEYFIPLDQIIQGNIIQTRGIAESNLEQISKIIWVQQLVEDGVREVEREKDILDKPLFKVLQKEIEKNTMKLITFDVGNGKRVSLKVGNPQISGLNSWINFVCQSAYQVRDQKSWRWVCTDLQLVHLSHHMMDSYLSEEQIVLEHETDIINFRRLLPEERGSKNLKFSDGLGVTSPDPFQRETKRHKMRKLDLYTAEVANFKFQKEFQSCSNIVHYFRYMLTLCDYQGRKIIKILDINSIHIEEIDQTELISGNLSQLKLSTQKEYLLIESFSDYTNRYIKLWIFQLELLNVTFKTLKEGKPEEAELEVKDSQVYGKENIPLQKSELKVHFIRSFSLNSLAYTTIIHRDFKGPTSARDSIHIYSIDCYPGIMCMLIHDATLVKEFDDYKVEIGGKGSSSSGTRDPKTAANLWSSKKPIEFVLSDDSKTQNILMQGPRMTSLYQDDPHNVFLYINFGAGNDFIFRIEPTPEKFDIDQIPILKVSNPFYGTIPSQYKTPVCYEWCCVTIGTYGNSTFLKFYNMHKNKLSDKDLPTFSKALKQLDPHTQKPVSNIRHNIESLHDKNNLHTFQVFNLSGEVLDIKFDPTMIYTNLTAIILLRSGEIKNITITKYLRIQVNNLYLASSDLNIFVEGMNKQELKMSFKLIPFNEDNK